MKTITAIATAIVVLGLFLGATVAGTADQEIDEMKAQLTIYVTGPLLEEGGTLIVVSNPISQAEWENLPEGNNPASGDPNNEKKKELARGDRLFGVMASTKVSIVEFVYPENGTFGFNLVAVEQPEKRGPPLRTQRILVGSQRDYGEGPDPKTKDVSVIHVYGPAVSEGDSRAVRASQHLIERLNPKQTVYQGASVYSPTDQQVSESVIDSEEVK